MPDKMGFITAEELLEAIKFDQTPWPCPRCGVKKPGLLRHGEEWRCRPCGWIGGSYPTPPKPGETGPGQPTTAQNPKPPGCAGQYPKLKQLKPKQPKPQSLPAAPGRTQTPSSHGILPRKPAQPPLSQPQLSLLKPSISVLPPQPLPPQAKPIEKRSHPAFRPLPPPEYDQDQLDRLETDPRPRCQGTLAEPHKKRLMRHSTGLWTCLICDFELSNSDFELLRERYVRDALLAAQIQQLTNLTGCAGSEAETIMIKQRIANLKRQFKTSTPKQLHRKNPNLPILDVVHIPLPGGTHRPRTYKPAPKRSYYKYEDDETNQFLTPGQIWLRIFRINEQLPPKEKKTDEELLAAFKLYIPYSPITIQKVNRARHSYNLGKLHGQTIRPTGTQADPFARQYLRLPGPAPEKQPRVYRREYRQRHLKLIHSEGVDRLFKPPPPPPPAPPLPFARLPAKHQREIKNRAERRVPYAFAKTIRTVPGCAGSEAGSSRLRPAEASPSGGEDSSQKIETPATEEPKGEF